MMLSKQAAIELRYARRAPIDLSVYPSCDVCRRPMCAGQRRRHGVCSPRLECCGAFTDLVGDTRKHTADHAGVRR